jgi:putative ABC transport system substrate-binding protein
VGDAELGERTADLGQLRLVDLAGILWGDEVVPGLQAAVGYCYSGSEARLMRRREFIAGLGSAAAWPAVARAQQRDRMRRIGVLIGNSAGDSAARSWVEAFREALIRSGWIESRNVQIDERWTTDADQVRRFAKQLVELQPDAILANGTQPALALRQETLTIPVVFTLVSDPVGMGLVAGLPRPDGNMTGFIHVEGTIAGKWLR